MMGLNKARNGRINEAEKGMVWDESGHHADDTCILFIQGHHLELDVSWDACHHWGKQCYQHRFHYFLNTLASTAAGLLLALIPISTNSHCMCVVGMCVCVCVMV